MKIDTFCNNSNGKSDNPSLLFFILFFSLGLYEEW